MTALRRLTATETLLFLREPMNWVFALVLPPVILVALGAVPQFRTPEEDLGGLRVIDLYAPIVVATAITMLALATLPQHFATYRDKGVLRRMRVSPVRPLMMLGAQLLMYLLMSLVTTLAVLLIARLGFGVDLPRQLGAYLVALALTASAMLSVGLLVASLAPTGPSAGTIGTILLFPMLFLAGLWIPRDSMHEVLRTISDFSPLGAGVQSLQDATAGDWPQLLHVTVLVGWTILAGGLAARYFRWE
ncbi:ABC transporter permease [Promicromonospora sp. NPDC057488]|uniref:ABC transporter permease n=1 Tax=Promicromonospora sp. NPDC057488 TaxID=3346147 RepID=UPI00366D6996